MKTLISWILCFSKSIGSFITNYQIKRNLILILFFEFFAFSYLSATIIVPISEVDSVFNVVDKQPVFKGKPSDVDKFIKNNLKYPEESWLKGIEGIVGVSFIITSEGKLINSKIEKSVNAELDIEALRLIDMMDNWKPGLIDKIPVNTYILTSVEFKLTSEERDFINVVQKYGLDKNPPLYVIDDKIVNTLIQLPSYNLESVRVIKGEKAVKLYGERAKNGVVVITTKRGTPPVR